MTKTFLPASLILVAGCLFSGAVERVYLQDGSHLRISIETCQERQGWTPLHVSLAGAEIEAWMDAGGRVFSGFRGELGSAEPLFTIELARSEIVLDGAIHPVHVYERNAVRTRFWFAAVTVELPLRLDARGQTGTLYLGRMAIPAQVGEPDRLQVERHSLAPGNALPSFAVFGQEARALLEPGRIRERSAVTD